MGTDQPESGAAGVAAPPRYDGPDTPESRRERERVAAGELPARYGEPWGLPFFEAAQERLEPGCVVLDVGSGRNPALERHQRPEGCWYVGLDISLEELEAAPADAYDEIHAADISEPIPADLRDRFDVVLSWQVLEHVPSMTSALDHIHSCLKPGGRLVAMVSGSFAAFSILARIIPYPIADQLMQRLLGADPDEKFPTRYDRCHRDALEPLLARWSDHRLLPLYKGAGYFRFFRPLERAYLAYENWLVRSGRSRMATHYLIVADR